MQQLTCFSLPTYQWLWLVGNGQDDSGRLQVDFASSCRSQAWPIPLAKRNHCYAHLTRSGEPLASLLFQKTDDAFRSTLAANRSKSLAPDLPLSLLAPKLTNSTLAVTSLKTLTPTLTTIASLSLCLVLPSGTVLLPARLLRLQPSQPTLQQKSPATPQLRNRLRSMWMSK